MDMDIDIDIMIGGSKRLFAPHLRLIRLIHASHFHNLTASHNPLIYMLA